jgi:hypothetical protein
MSTQPNPLQQPQQQPPATPAPAAPEKPNAAIWGDDEKGAQTVAQDTGFADSVKSYWHRANDVLNTGWMEPIHGWLDKANDSGTQLVQSLKASNHPYASMLTNAYMDVQKDVLGFLNLNPKNALAVAATGGTSAVGKSVLAQALTSAYNLYLAHQGAKNLFTGRQAQETAIDYANRLSMDTLQAGLGGTASALTAGSTLNNIHDVVQNRLGLSGDLAAKVQAKVEAAQQIEAAGKGEAATTSEIAQGIDKDISERQIPQRTGKIMADAAQVIHAEKARVEGLFSDLEDKATAPVTTSPDMRAEIVNTLTAHGVQPDEIPAKIFSALPQEQNATTVRALTASELKAASMASKWAHNGMGGDDMRGALINLGYVPKQVDAIMNVAAPKLNTGDVVSFKATTRVREDLYNAAQSATDSTLKRALFEAHDNVTGIQQRYADENGFGKQYETAKNEYRDFKRGLGDGPMNDFMSAYDVHEQNMLRHTSALMNPTQAETFRRLFTSFGVDASPLSDIIDEQKSTAEGAKQRISDIEAETEQRVKDLGLDHSIMRGESDLQFAGQSTLQIRQNAIRKLVQNSRKVGISDPYSLMQIMYGGAMLGMGSMFGTLHIARGMAPEGIRAMLNNPTFQDWAAHESGVDPTLTKFRSGLGNATNKLQKLADSFKAYLK